MSCNVSLFDPASRIQVPLCLRNCNMFCCLSAKYVVYLLFCGHDKHFKKPSFFHSADVIA